MTKKGTVDKRLQPKTFLQKRAVKKLVEQVRKKQRPSVSRAMREAGYSHTTATAPAKLTRSKSFKELCDECGLTDNLILESLASDIKKKPRRRAPELALGARIKGMFKEDNEQQAMVGDKTLDTIAQTLKDIFSKK